ncbi:hypothetical protein C8F01DRAFT_117901 [Mycena amicta]|nr:hypothetical protein C8F01DRAFT_117901 [Mycena amicta]
MDLHPYASAFLRVWRDVDGGMGNTPSNRFSTECLSHGPCDRSAGFSTLPIHCVATPLSPPLFHPRPQGFPGTYDEHVGAMSHCRYVCISHTHLALLMDPPPLLRYEYFLRRRIARPKSQAGRGTSSPIHPSISPSESSLSLTASARICLDLPRRLHPGELHRWLTGHVSE